MRSVFLFLVLSFLFVFVAGGQDLSDGKTANDKKGRELSGPVSSVRIHRELAYSADDKGFDGGWIPSLTVFNRNGFVKEFTAYDDTGKSYYKTVSEFDSSGHKMQEATYDANGKLTRNSVMAYDARGNMIERKDYGNKDLSLMSWGKFFFNRAGYITHQSYFSKQGKRLSTTKYEYYASRKKKSETGYNASGKFISGNIFFYNKKNVKIIVYDKPGIITRRYATLINEVGDQTELSYDESGKLASKSTYTYERDAQGNWIKEVCSEWESKDGFLKLERIKITTREIIYY